MATATPAAPELRFDPGDIAWTAWESWVRMNGEVTLTGRCRRCSGTGAFTTYIENGVPKGPGGPCFRCNGKGYQTDADRRRNTYHDEHYAARLIAADLRA